MSTAELEFELGQAEDEYLLECLLGGDESAPARRLQRVARELARRDYRYRPHGRTCACSECVYLLDVWRSLQRRSIHHLDTSPE